MTSTMGHFAGWAPASLLAVAAWVLGCGGEANGHGAGPFLDASVAEDGAIPGAAGPLAYRRLVFASVYAEDQPALLEWYTEVVGLPPGEANWFALADGSSVEVFAGGVSSDTTKSPAQQSVVAGLQVPNLDTAVAALEGRGLEFLGPAEQTPGEDRWRYFADPEGNRFEVKDVGEPRDGDAYEAIPWVGVYAEDFDAMTDWYQNVLGLPLDASIPPFFSVFRFGRGDYIELFSDGVASTTKKSTAQQSVVSALEVPDVEAARAELERRGVGGWGELGMWHVPPAPNERAIEFLDPEGNRWVLKDYGKEF